MLEAAAFLNRLRKYVRKNSTVGVGLMFIDVRPSDWYYDDISELNDTPTYGYVKF